MKQMNIGQSVKLEVPRIAVGCMRIANMEPKQLQEHIVGCLDQGMNFFDHADIYGRGACEKVFGEAVKKLQIPRDKMILQSKCGIIPKASYDFSKKHIMEAVENSLRSLQTEYLDILLLHRPDTLCEPEEVAETFDELQKSGKVRAFGVSNHNPMQIELLKKAVKQDLIINQLQFSIPASGMISEGFEVNMMTEGAVNRDGYVLDYCRIHDITIQVWSPFQYGFFEGNFLGNQEKFPELSQLLKELAKKYGITETGIATAWILRHPANMQMIAGTTRLLRMEEIKAGSEITLSREDWYRLYLSTGKKLP